MSLKDSTTSLKLDLWSVLSFFICTCSNGKIQRNTHLRLPPGELCLDQWNRQFLSYVFWKYVNTILRFPRWCLQLEDTKRFEKICQFFVIQLHFCFDPKLLFLTFALNDLNNSPTILNESSLEGDAKRGFFRLWQYIIKKRIIFFLF